MLMHAHRGAVDHLHIAVKGLADRGHDAVPNPGFAPPHKAVVAGRGRAELLRQSTRRSSTRGTPRGLFGKSGAITPHSKSVSSYACRIQLPQLGSLNHIAIPLGIPFMSPGPRCLVPGFDGALFSPALTAALWATC